MNTLPIMLLVDSAAGIYTYDSLVTRYPVYVGEDNRKPLAEWLASNPDFLDETVDTVFHPDNEHWCDNIDTIENHGLYVQHTESGEFWRVESVDGDIFAVNPAAEWSDETETYILPGDQS